MRALSELFDETTLVLPRKTSPPPAGLTPLSGRRLVVEAFAEPAGIGWRRKVAWLLGGVGRLRFLWRQAGRGDAVHAAVPGDVGFVGLVLALLRRRRIFVRHCGTWGKPQTLADHLLLRLLVRVAGERCVVLATGGDTEPPSAANPAISWIFSTSLSESELDSPDAAAPRRHEAPPVHRLITVGRLTAGKNVSAAIRALAELRQSHPGLVLDVVGDGPEAPRLRDLARELDLRDVVSFWGNLDHAGVIERLQSARVMLFPTRVAEGFPKAVLEALSCGVPVIVPRVSVLPYLLRQGGGLLVDDVEPGTLAAAASRLLDESEEHSHHAEVGRRIARSYTLEAWAETIGRRLESAWGESLAAPARGAT